jgi:hypothetical protein
MLLRRCRASRSLIMSSAGMRPRMMRSWLARSMGRATPSRARRSSLGGYVAAVDTVQQRVDLVLGKQVFLAHVTASRSW